MFTDPSLAVQAGPTFTGPTALIDAVRADTTLDGYHVVADTVGTDTYTSPGMIPKSLTVVGPNDGISPNTGTRVAEVVIDTTAGPLSAADGKSLAVRGFAFTTPAGKGAISTFAENYQVDFSFNRVENQFPLFGQVYFLNGIPTGSGYTKLTVRENRFADNDPQRTAIRISNGSNATVSDNVVLGGFIGVSLDTSTATGVNSPVVTNNYIAGTTQEGVRVGDFVKNAVVTLNTITGVNTGGAADRGGIRVIAGVGPIDPGPLGSLTIANNLVVGSNGGLVFSGGTFPVLTALAVRYNVFEANAGTAVVATGNTNDATLDLSGNWFGSNDPAAIDAAVTGTRAASVRAYLSDDANARPDALSSTSGRWGFDPLLPAVEIWVPQRKATSGLNKVDGVVQTGVNLALEGMIVRLDADTYTENVAIPGGRSLTLRGNGPGKSVVNGTITATGGTAANTLALNDLTLGGGTVSGYGGLTFGSTGPAGGTYAISGTAFTRAGDQPTGLFNVSGIGILTTNAGTGADRFTVTPSATTTLAINASTPTTRPGDILTVDTDGTTGPAFTGPLPSGTFSAAGKQLVAWTGIEDVTNIRGKVTITPTAGDNFRVVRNGANVEVFNIDAFTPTQKLVLTGPVAGADAITSLAFVGTAGVSNQVWVDLSAGDAVPDGGIAVAGDGGTDPDRVYVLGNGATTAAYTASGTAAGAGTLDTGFGPVTVTGLVGIDLTGFATAAVALPDGSTAATTTGSSFAAIPTTGTALVATAVRLTGTGGGVALAGVSVSATPAVTVRFDGGSQFTAGGDFTAAGIAQLTLNAGTGVADATTQTAGLTVGALELVGTGGFDLTNPTNTIAALAAAVAGNVRFATAGGLTVGTVGGTAGATASGDIELSFGRSGADAVAVVNAAVSGATASLFGGFGADTITVNATAAGQTLTVNAGGGKDAITVNTDPAQSGTVLIPNVGGAGFTDTLTVNGTAAADTFTVNADAQTVVVGGLTVGFTVGIGAVNLDAGGGDDTYVVRFGNTVLPQLTLTDGAGQGTDAAFVFGTARGDVFDVNRFAPNEVRLGFAFVSYTGTLEAVTVSGLDGNDTFNLTPSTTTLLTVDGGSPANVAAGDTLNLDLTGVANPVVSVPRVPDGSLTSISHKRVSWVSIEGVTPTDTPPTISPIPDQTTTAGVAVGPLPFTVADAETFPADLTVTTTSSNQTLVSAGNIVVGGSGANRTVTITPASGQTGTTTITVTVTDDGGGTATETFLVTVAVPPPNTPPTITPIADQTTTVGTAVGPLPFTVGDAETPAANLVLSATSSNPTLVPNGNVALGGSGANRTVSVTPAAGQTGTATITVTVTDGNGGTATETFLITVTPPPNTPPTVSDIPDRTTSDGVTVGPVGFTVGDAETPPAGLTVTATSSNPGLVPAGNVTLGGGGANRTITITPVVGQTGTTTITLTVTDGSGGTTTETFTITVTPNRPPTVSAIPDRTATVGTVIGPVGFTVGDPETPAAALTVTATSSNPALVPNGNVSFGGSGSDRTVTVVPVAGQVGTTTITVTVTDDRGQTATTSFAVTFTPAANTAPTVSAIPDQTTPSGTTVGPVRFTVADAESPAENISVTATSDDPNLVPDAGIVIGGSGENRTVTVTPAAGRAGRATVTVTATDAGGAVTRTTFTVTVLPLPSDSRELYAVGAGAGGGPRVQVFDAATDARRFDFYVYEPEYRGGVRVAVGDVTGDGFDDIVVGTGTGGGPRVVVYDGRTGVRVADFFAYEASFRGGVHVAVGDIDGDGVAEIITGAGSTGSPRVRSFAGRTFAPFQDFFAYPMTQFGGVRVAAGDLDGDGKAEIVTAEGPSGETAVNVYSGTNREPTRTASADLLGIDYRGGLFVAVVPAVAGGVGQVVVSADSVPDYSGSVFESVKPGLGQELVTFTPSAAVYQLAGGTNTPATLVEAVTPYGEDFLGGVRIGGGFGDRADFVTSPGEAGGGLVRMYKYRGTGQAALVREFQPFEDAFVGGIYVG